jgi:hypothetical protein
VAIELGEERGTRGFEHVLESALRIDHTAAPHAFTVRKAAHQRKVGFRGADDLAHRECARGGSEPQPAIAAAHRLHPAQFAELLHHLHQMIFRNAVGVGNFLDGRKSFVAGRQVQDHAERVVGIVSQSHGNESAFDARFAQKTLSVSGLRQSSARHNMRR